ncbi:hypothetical protein ACIBCN_36945 [Nocardia sp. NPDC051052]|uniref:hypothetical protein n=1 Tax=Nocardia sp. NPDC051052 TaxID=3364322 RepID=UPI003788E404
MALDPDISDNTKWAGLPGEAANGHLSLEAGIAEKCARHVEDMLNVIVGVHTWIFQNFMRASPPIANTTSGSGLYRVYNEKIATELTERMDRHRTILTDMGNTFVAAGKNYQTTEHDNTVSFQDISFVNLPGTPPSGSPKPGSIPKHPRKNSSQSTVYDPIAIVPEPGSQFSWSQLYMIGNSINPQAVADAAGVWYWLSKTLDTGFTTLRSNIYAAGVDWQGAGAQSATQATTQYVGASLQLTGDMNLLGDNMLNTSGWLQQTKQNATPPTPELPSSPNAAEQYRLQIQLFHYQANFQTYYTTNFPQTTSTIVALPQPDQVAVVPALDNSEPLTEGGSGLPARDLDTSGKPEPGGDNPGDSEPGGTEPGGSEPGGSNPGGTEPGGSNPGGSDPGGSNPGGSDPGGSQPGGSNPGKPAPTDHMPTGALPSTTHKPGELSVNPLARPPLAVNSSTGPGTGRGPFGGIGGKSIVGAKGLLSAEELLAKESKLFPRASIAPKEVPLGRSGPVGGREPGFPIGGAPGARRDEEKQRKRLELLNSTEHLDEALGTPGRGVRPVLER